MDSPRLDGELLIAHALGISRVQLYMDLDRPLGKDELVKIRSLVSRRRAFEPIAYIRGCKEFYGRSYNVAPGVLIPRPETETLVELAIQELRKRAGADEIGSAVDGEGGVTSALPAPAAKTIRVLDLCSGSGCIGVTLAAECPNVDVVMVDLDPVACALARANATQLLSPPPSPPTTLSDEPPQPQRWDIRQGDLFAPVRGERFDVVVSNPPYIATGELNRLMPDVAYHEPKLALDGGQSGLTFYERLVQVLPDYLVSGGSVYFEIGHDQGQAVQRLLQGVAVAVGRDPACVTVHQDLAGLDRVVALV